MTLVLFYGAVSKHVQYLMELWLEARSWLGLNAL